MHAVIESMHAISAQTGGHTTVKAIKSNRGNHRRVRVAQSNHRVNAIMIRVSHSTAIGWGGDW